MELLVTGGNRESIAISFDLDKLLSIFYLLKN